MPSVSSSSRPKVWLSSTVMTPSLPTLSMASAIISPICRSAAEIDAVAAICSLVSTSLAMLSSSSETAATACSMPRLRAIGLAPAATLRRPSRTIAWASTVAVVVPSPATSSVFLATSLTSSAPIFSYGSSSSISLAMLTPSLVMVGAPHFFSRTTLRPFGPRVTLTASARMFIPRSRPRRASSSKAMILAIRVVPPTRNGWVTGWRPRRTERIRRAPFARVLRPSPDSRNYHSHGESANPMISTRPPRVQMPDGMPDARSGLGTETSGRTGTLTSGTQAIQTFDQHRVGLQCGRVVDQGVEHLVVACGAHVEELADGLFLGTGIFPPLALERDDLAVAVAQLTRWRDLDLCRGVHMASPGGVRSSRSYRPNDTLVIHLAVRPTRRSHSSRGSHAGLGSGHRVQNGGDVVLCGGGINDGETGNRLTFVRGRHHEGELLAHHLSTPGVVVLGLPAEPPEDHHGQVGLTQRLEIGAPGDLGLRIPGHLKRSYDRRRVGPGPVSGQREPQGQPASPAGQPDRVLGRVPLRVVEHVEVRSLLCVCPTCQSRLSIQQGTAVIGGEEPLVRVDDEGVGVLDPVEQVTNRWGGQPRPAVGAVDMQPDAVLAADHRHRVEVVHDAEVRGARRRDHGEEGLGTLGLQHHTQVVPGEPLVLVTGNPHQLGVHDVAGRPDRGVRPPVGCHPGGPRPPGT